MKTVLIGWNELPPYAEELIHSAIALSTHDVHVVASRPRVPFANSGSSLGTKLHWVDNHSALKWADLGLPIPDIYFQPSWVYPVFNRLGREVRERGGSVIGLFDNCWKGNLRQLVGAVWFRLYLRNHFSAVWVPGLSGYRLAELWGFSRNTIITGLYGISEKKFHADAPGHGTREKVFCFVGQLIERKGVPELLRAFSQFRLENKEWRLAVYGDGPLRSLVENVDGVCFHGFKQPEVISGGLRTARFLILPSREDHWPLVVCEAAHAGCGLMVSDKVGNRFELVREGNGLIFKHRSVSAILEAFRIASGSRFSDAAEISRTSAKLAAEYTPARWAEKFIRICEA